MSIRDLSACERGRVGDCGCRTIDACPYQGTDKEGEVAKQPPSEATPSAAEPMSEAELRAALAGHDLEGHPWVRQALGAVVRWKAMARSKDRLVQRLAEQRDAQESRAREAEEALREIANAPKGGPLAAKARRALAQRGPDAQ